MIFLGIVALTIITSLADESVNVAVVLLKVVLFFCICRCCGFCILQVFIKNGLKALTADVTDMPS